MLSPHVIYRSERSVEVGAFQDPGRAREFDGAILGLAK